MAMTYMASKSMTRALPLFMVVMVTMLQRSCVLGGGGVSLASGSHTELVDCSLNDLFLGPGDTANCTCKLKDDDEVVDKVAWVSTRYWNETETGVRNATVQVSHVDISGYQEMFYCNLTNGSDVESYETFSVKMGYGPKDLGVTIVNAISLNAVARCESTVNVTVRCDLTNIPVPNATATVTADGNTYSEPIISNGGRDFDFVVNTDESGELNVTCDAANGLFPSITETTTSTLTIHTPPTSVTVSVTHNGESTAMGNNGADNITLTLGKAASIQCQPNGQYPTSATVVLECGANHTAGLTGSAALTLSIASVDSTLNGTECFCNVTHTSDCGTQTVSFTIDTVNQAAPMVANVGGGLFMAAALVMAMWAGSDVDNIFY